MRPRSDQPTDLLEVPTIASLLQAALELAEREDNDLLIYLIKVVLAEATENNAPGPVGHA